MTATFRISCGVGAHTGDVHVDLDQVEHFFFRNLTHFAFNH